MRVCNLQRIKISFQIKGLILVPLKISRSITIDFYYMCTGPKVLSPLRKVSCNVKWDLSKFLSFHFRRKKSGISCCFQMFS